MNKNERISELENDIDYRWDLISYLSTESARYKYHRDQINIEQDEIISLENSVPVYIIRHKETGVMTTGYYYTYRNLLPFLKNECELITDQRKVSEILSNNPDIEIYDPEV